MSQSELEARIARLEAREDIRALPARYGLAIDDRDIDALRELFAENSSVRSKDGVLNAVGREAVIDQYHGRFAVLGPTFHVAHDHLIWFEDNDERARGMVTSHAEVVRNGQPLLAAMRYEDAYVREDGTWRFADRLLWFFYYMDVTEYASGLVDSQRQRAYGDRRPADFPEPLATWRAYHPGGDA